MRRFLFLTCFLLCFVDTFAQIVNNNWYFGYGTDGIKFTSEGPQKVSDKLFQVGFEGMIVVNDPVTGEMLFYSDGRQAVNKNHQVMTNGANLNGHWSGSQCVQCCPVPGSCGKKYFLFTNMAWDLNPGGIYYSIVDFTSNPLGEVTTKNELIWNGTADQAMCLVNKPNTTDYWLVTNIFNTATYKVWPISSAVVGVPATYTFSAYGTTYQMNYSEQAGKIIVTGMTGNRSLTLLNFNTNTGVLSNEYNLGQAEGMGFFSGARFSPDGTKLYADRESERSLYQYDFLTSTFTNVNTCCYAHDLKMGPDGKMYFIHTYYESQPMSVIDFPNETAVGNKCNYHKLTFPVAFNGEVRRFPEILTLPTPPAANTDSSDFTGTPLSIDVLQNDTDPLGLTLSVDAIISAPRYGTATIAGSQISYNSTSTRCNFRDTLIYRITNANCQGDTACVIFKKTSPPITTSGSLTICSGDSFDGHTTNGTYTHTYITALGCDSIRTTILTVNPPIAATTKSVTVCEGEKYDGHGVSGTYTTHFTAVNGCDSTAILELTVTPIQRTSVTITICEGDNYAGHTATGTYADTYTAISGCDSIRTLHLTVTPIARTTVTIAICEGKSYEGYSATGVYTNHFTAISGCDSIRTLRLTVLAASHSTRAVSICEGQTYLGHSVTGSFQNVLTAANGCDSIETIQLTVKPRAGSLFTAAICEGENYLGYTQTGEYKDVFVAANGCDSVRTIRLTVNAIKRTTVDTTICDGSNYYGYTAPGAYTDVFRSVTGCDSIRTLTLQVVAPPVPVLGNDTLICTGSTLTLFPGVFDNYRWQDGSTAGAYIVKGAGVYTVIINNVCGTGNAAIRIGEKTCRIYFPDAFTPNKDGLNDVFHILTEHRLLSYHLVVYNRWGQKIYETADYTQGWDGTYQGQKAMPGTYVWYCEYVSPVETGKLKGTVVLIR